MGVWIICRICGTQEYIPHINTTNKRKLFEWGFWDCCEFARAQHYLIGSGKRIRLEFDVVKGGD